MNEQIDNMINHGDIILSCSITHDMHCEHRMPAHSIIFIRSGRLIIENRDEKDIIESGNYVFVRRDCSVNVTKVPLNSEPYRGINLRLPRKELKEYYNRISGSCKRVHHVSHVDHTVNILPKTAGLKSLFDSIIPFIDCHETPSDEWLQLKACEAIMCLLNTSNRFYPTLFDFNETWKIDLLDFMEENYTEDLTLEELASYTGRSVATFKRDFAKISPIPPQRWIMEHRLDKARTLLMEKGVSTQELAYIVGFKNRSHFSQAFKKRFGYAPNNYLKVYGNN